MRYNKLHRYILYYYQVYHTLKTSPKNVLDVGIGNKTVIEQLNKTGIQTTSCDICSDLEPDVVGDIRNLPFGDNVFDTVSACEVLEHIPFDDFEVSLKELRRVSRRNVIISIPYSSAFFQFRIKFKFSLGKINLDFDRSITLRLPYFFKKIDIEENKKHYWEMGAKNFPKNKVEKILNKYFNISKQFYVPLSPNHYFFILEKK